MQFMHGNPSRKRTASASESQIEYAMRGFLGGFQNLSGQRLFRQERKTALPSKNDGRCKAAELKRRLARSKGDLSATTDISRSIPGFCGFINILESNFVSFISAT